MEPKAWSGRCHHLRLTTASKLHRKLSKQATGMVDVNTTDERRKKNMRTLLLLALVAVAFYVGFIAMTAMSG